MFSARPVLVAVVAACGLLLVSAPCATAGDGKVIGKITLNGKPLAAGKVTFYLDNGQFVGSKVKDGEYTVDRVPAGMRRVTVEGQGIPPTFTSEETSPLQMKVKEGPNTFAIELM
jgi:hypothetical protein